MSIFKQQVNSSSDFPSFFSVITYILPLNLQPMHFLRWTKGSRENTNFDTFKYSGEDFAKFLMSFCKRQVRFSSNFASHSSVTKYNSSFFSSNTTYFGQKQPNKVYIFETFEFSSHYSLNSLCQFLNDKLILLQIFIILQCHYLQLLFKFVAHAFSTLDKRIPSFSKPQVSFSSNFAPFFGIIRHNSSILI